MTDKLRGLQVLEQAIRIAYVAKKEETSGSGAASLVRLLDIDVSPHCYAASQAYRIIHELSIELSSQLENIADYGSGALYDSRLRFRAAFMDALIDSLELKVDFEENPESNSYILAEAFVDYLIGLDRQFNIYHGLAESASRELRLSNPPLYSLSMVRATQLLYSIKTGPVFARTELLTDAGHDFTMEHFAAAFLESFREAQALVHDTRTGTEINIARSLLSYLRELNTQYHICKIT